MASQCLYPQWKQQVTHSRGRKFEEGLLERICLDSHVLYIRYSHPLTSTKTRMIVQVYKSGTIFGQNCMETVAESSLFRGNVILCAWGWLWERAYLNSTSPSEDVPCWTPACRLPEPEALNSFRSLSVGPAASPLDQLTQAVKSHWIPPQNNAPG